MQVRRKFCASSLLLCACALLGLCSVASAQSFLGLHRPEADVFAGYSLMRYDTVPLGFSQRLNLNGGMFELSLPDIYQGIGIAAEFSGHYSSEMENFNFLVGPRYRREVKGVYLFGHGLWGKSRTRLENLGTSQLWPSTLGYSVALGGGAEIPWRGRFSIRPFQADYLITSAYGDRRHNIRYSGGIVIRFGKPAAKAPLF